MRQSKRCETRFEVLYPLGARRRGMDDPRRFPLGLMTVPASRLYAAASGRMRDVALRKRDGGTDGVTVISVGNLEMGGNGKTPLAIFLIDHLVSHGHRPAYVSRGFMSEAERIKSVTATGWDDLSSAYSAAAEIRYVRRGSRGLSAAIGDEGALVAMRCPTTPLFFSRDRRLAVRMAIDRCRPSHVVLDDAFQTWGLWRDLDIVLLDAEHPLGNGHVVPAGSLRETPAAVARAHLVGINGYRSPDDLNRFAEWVERIAGRAIPVFGLSRSIALFEAATGAHRETLAGPVVSLSSIARPQRFDDALVDHGLNLVRSIRYPDHHRYRPGDLRRVDSWVRERGACVVTTEKDWAKLRDEELPLGRVFVTRLDVSFEPAALLSEIERPRGNPAAVSSARTS